jgi:hypothetical protein
VNQQPARGQVDLSTLGLADLQRLLDVARARGQPGLAERLTAEIDARRRGRVTPPPAPAPARRKRRAGAAIAVLAASAAIGAGLAWGLGAPRRLARAPDPAPRAMVVQTTLLRAPPPAVAPAAAPAAEDVAPPPAPAPHNACLDRPTPGQRLLCGYPSLALQDHRLAEAYERALQAAPDPIALATDQTTWRSARDAISDRETMSAFYAARIAELEAAAEPREPTP